MDIIIATKKFKKGIDITITLVYYNICKEHKPH